MKLLPLALITAFLCLPLGADDAMKPAPPLKLVPDPFAPARFNSLYIEKDDGASSIVIQLAGDAVTYKSSVGNKVLENITVHPSPDDWFQFIQGLNTAKVYKWAPKYYYPGQGTNWVIDFATDDRKFTSVGTNEYPKEGAEDQPRAAPQALPSTPFQYFWQAALTLVGKGPVQKGQAGG